MFVSSAVENGLARPVLLLLLAQVPTHERRRALDARSKHHRTSTAVLRRPTRRLPNFEDVQKMMKGDADYDNNHHHNHHHPSSRIESHEECDSSSSRVSLSAAPPEGEYKSEQSSSNMPY
jgi:hypothetical protein